MSELRREYVEALRREGALRRDDVAAAFGRVPRELFVADGFYGRDGVLVTPEHPDFPAAVYRNDVLVTKVVDGAAVSSSSQPSLMAAMIESLELEPGMRVLEIGAGTGYNAALMAVLGARVTSVDVQPDVVERAAAALARAGTGDAVRVRLGDGYLGDPDGASYDRVVATVGVAGVSPYWLAQLAPDGFVLAPVGHAGTHPVLRVRRRADGTVTGRGVLPAGFMRAAGPLSARYPWAHPEPVADRVLAEPTVSRPGCWEPPLEAYRYYDLWFAAGVWDRRVTFGAVAGVRGAGGCLLLDPAGAGGAGLLADGAVHGAGAEAERYADAAVALRDRWIREGEPRIDEWFADLPSAGEPDRPIHVPHHWRRSP
ncbi:methyltransferase [Micromonospora sp. NPDC049559]|uniref:protein-L-isoaspartate O-methyltransferase family protein n=1 Tax=Micromonospora sp. NPDC049559 TaxID=3155923 RepID=UPI00343DFD37